MATYKDKVNVCVNKYGLNEDEAIRIIKADNCVLTLEELRIKYDNPNLGKEYPEWLTPTDHYKMCCTTVRNVYNANFVNICTAEDLAHTLFVNTSLKLNTMKNHKMLKDYIVKQSMNIYRDATRRSKYWAPRSIDDKVFYDTTLNSYDNNKKLTFVENLKNFDTEKDEQECLLAVKSIKNREIRELLILCGYIIGNINGFRADFIDIVQNSDLILRDKLLELFKDIDDNDKIDRCKADGGSVKGKKKHSIKLKTILDIMKIDLDIKNAREEIGYYLATTKFLPN